VTPLKKKQVVGHWWLIPVILAAQEAEVRRIAVQSQPRQIVHKTLSRKTLYKNWAGRVAQGEGPEYCKKKEVTVRRLTSARQKSPETKLAWNLDIVLLDSRTVRK
jgi:hypothetical protein